MATCAVKFCGKSNRKSNYQNEGITFHRFPKVSELKNLWTFVMCRDEDWTPTPFSVVCSRHFTEKDFQYMKNRRKLVENALPTLNLPEMVSKTLQEASEEAKMRCNLGAYYIENIEKYLEDPAESPGLPITVKSSEPNKTESARVKSFKSQFFKAYKNKLLNLNHPMKVNADVIDSEPKKKKEITERFPLRYCPKDYFHIVKLSGEEMLKKRELDKSSKKYQSYAYKCDKCIIGFDDECLYERHVKDAHEFFGKFVCPICEIRVARPTNFRQHVDNHYRYFQCKKCNFGHHNYRMLVTHARNHERRETEKKYGRSKKKSKQEKKPKKVSCIPILLGDLQL